jgi:hypothetical protein
LSVCERFNVLAFVNPKFEVPGTFNAGIVSVPCPLGNCKKLADMLSNVNGSADARNTLSSNIAKFSVGGLYAIPKPVVIVCYKHILKIYVYNIR